MGASAAERQRDFKASMEAQGYIYTSLYISQDFNQEIKKLMFERGFKKHEAVEFIFKSYQQPPEPEQQPREQEDIDRLTKIEEILKEHDNKLNILFEKIAAAPALTVKTNNLFTDQQPEPVQDNEQDQQPDDWVELDTIPYYQALKEIRDSYKGAKERLEEVKRRKIKRKTKQGYKIDWTEKTLKYALNNISKYLTIDTSPDTH